MKPMSTGMKRGIFFGLLFLFIIYTVIVATSGTTHVDGISLNTDAARRGQLHYQKYNCGSCHQLYGLGGYMGPDLTNVISAPGKGPDFARALMQSGSVRMPDFGMSDAEIDELIAFLSYVDKTGVSPVTKYRLGWDGTVEIER